MKKTLLLGLLICAFTVGYTEKSEQEDKPNKIDRIEQAGQKAESLDSAYFDIVKKIENKEEIKSEYIKELLEGYTYTEDSFLSQHIFNNDSESLIIKSAFENEEEKLSEISYGAGDGANNVSLEYKAANDSRKLYISAIVEDISLYEKISETVDNKDYKLLKSYNEISKDIATTNNLTVDDVIKKINIEPTSDSYDDINNNLEITRYIFKNDDETMTVHYIKDKDKLGTVTYSKNESDGRILFAKNTIIGEMSLAEDKKLSASMSVPCDSISTQEKILNMMSK